MVSLSTYAAKILEVRREYKNKKDIEALVEYEALPTNETRKSVCAQTFLAQPHRHRKQGSDAEPLGGLVTSPDLHDSGTNSVNG